MEMFKRLLDKVHEIVGLWHEAWSSIKHVLLSYLKRGTQEGTI